MIVCIAEKPSVAREIAAVIGATQKRKGFIEGNGYCVTWTFGHLCTLKDPGDYKKEWKRWDSTALPMMPERFGIKLIDNDGVKEQFEVIKSLVTKADKVINCGDAGQEGELIQRWVLQLAGCKCPIERLWISSLTAESIKEGFNTLHPANDYQLLYEAGLARAIGDWLLGLNATRAYTLRYSGRNGNMLSVGRVQTPTLALIVERQKEIDNFKSSKYWELKTNYRDVTFSATTGKYEDKAKADADCEKITGQPFTITDVTRKEGKESAPKLFDLTSLQVECNKKFAYSADETLKIIQALYEKKYTTYPRVDTTYLSDDMYPKIPDILKGLKSYADIVTPLLDKPIRKSKKVFDNSKVTDHHAIIPTGVQPVGLSDMEKNVYDLVARRFIANFYDDSTVATTAVTGKSVDIEFRVTGKTILDPAWRVCFGKALQIDDDEQKEDNPTLPIFEVGETGEHQPQVLERNTQPPKPYTEATLLRAMETAGKTMEDEELRELMKENGIGRPSTRAAIIETLLKREYIKKVRKNLMATPKGIELIGIIKYDLLKSAELTGRWEKKLRGIEKKDVIAADFINELKAMVREVIKDVKSDNSRVTIGAMQEPELVKSLTQKASTRKKKEPEIVEGRACPKCGKGVIIKGRAAYGCSRWKEGCDWRSKPFDELNKK